MEIDRVTAQLAADDKGGLTDDQVATANLDLELMRQIGERRLGTSNLSMENTRKTLNRNRYYVVTPWHVFQWCIQRTITVIFKPRTH